MKKKPPNKLPKFLHRYFWDTEAEKVNPSAVSVYVINRLLDRGSLLSINWVLNNFPREIIKKTIKSRLDWQKKSINFWAHYFKLKHEEVRCLKKSYLSQRQSFWPY